MMPVLLSVCVLCAPAGMPSREDLVRELSNNFDAITSFYVQSRVYSRNLDPSKKEMAYDVEWAVSADGKIRRGESSNFIPMDNTPRPIINLAVYDGEVGLGVGFLKEDPEKQGFGIVFDDKKIFNHLIKSPASMSEFGRMWGKRIDGKSLAEWIAQEASKVKGIEIIDDISCVLVECSVRSPNDDAYRTKEFSLSQEHNYALKRVISFCDGEAVLSLKATSFKEVVSGVWLPMSGEIIPMHGHPATASGIKPYRFKVLNLEVTTKLPETLFTIDFQNGVEVYDIRYGTSMVWEDHFDIKDEASWLKMIESAKEK